MRRHERYVSRRGRGREILALWMGLLSKIIGLGHDKPNRPNKQKDKT